MDAIGPGDWVECVKGDRASNGSELVVGRVYLCEGLHTHTDSPPCGLCGNGGPGATGIRVREAPVEAYESWCPCSFKPVYRPKADLIESLKVPPELVDA